MTVAADRSEATADGRDVIIVTATQTLNGRAIAGPSVRFEVTGQATISPEAGTANVDGIVNASVTSTIAGAVSIRAYVPGGAESPFVSDSVTVQFR